MHRTIIGAIVAALLASGPATALAPGATISSAFDTPLDQLKPG